MTSIDCFKAYDVRGKVPSQLNEDIAKRIGQAFAVRFKPKVVAVGYDIRTTSPVLAKAVAEGLTSQGVDVRDIGLGGTEEIYHATSHFKLDGGIMVTASHNPIEYNGIKFVREHSIPVSGDTGLFDIRSLAENNEFTDAKVPGEVTTLDARPAYISDLLTYVDIKALKPLKIVCNAGNGGAGLIIDQLEQHLPFNFIKIQNDPDGSFPNGIPNPLLEERRQASIDTIKDSDADFGISWDGDFDRCFFFDENARFIEGYYIIGLLAQAFLKKNPGEKIIYDPRLTWNTIDIVESMGGHAIQSKTGHAFIKERLRKENAIYGGEMSAHHYFRDFAYCDSGMIPWLLVAELVSKAGLPLSALVDKQMQSYPCSGEINFKVRDAKQMLSIIHNEYAQDALIEDDTDGLGLEFTDWRFNIRSSNTEPLLRLNVESRGNQALMEEKTKAISQLIESFNQDNPVPQ